MIVLEVTKQSYKVGTHISLPPIWKVSYIQCIHNNAILFLLILGGFLLPTFDDWACIIYSQTNSKPIWETIRSYGDSIDGDITHVQSAVWKITVCKIKWYAVAY
jgi:hypothetical protein